MKVKIFALLLSGAMAITLTSCNNVAQNHDAGGSDISVKSAENSQNAGQTAKSQIKIEIVPPSGWQAVEGSVLPVQYMKGTASFMVKEEALFTAKALDDVISEAKGYFEKSFKSVSYEGEAKTLSVDGKDARQIMFVCTVSGMKMKYEYVYLYAGGKVYAITFGNLADQFDSLSDDYEQILADIRFRL